MNCRDRKVAPVVRFVGLSVLMLLAGLATGPAVLTAGGPGDEGKIDKDVIYVGCALGFSF